MVPYLKDQRKFDPMLETLTLLVSPPIIDIRNPAGYITL